MKKHLIVAIALTFALSGYVALAEAASTGGAKNPCAAPAGDAKAGEAKNPCAAPAKGAANPCAPKKK